MSLNETLACNTTLIKTMSTRTKSTFTSFQKTGRLKKKATRKNDSRHYNLRLRILHLFMPDVHLFLYYNSYA